MQLEIKRVQKRTPCGRTAVSFDVLCDGLTVYNSPSRSGAAQRMDAIWETRPIADRVLEQLYSGD